MRHTVSRAKIILTWVQTKKIIACHFFLAASLVSKPGHVMLETESMFVQEAVKWGSVLMVLQMVLLIVFTYKVRCASKLRNVRAWLHPRHKTHTTTMPKHAVRMYRVVTFRHDEDDDDTFRIDTDSFTDVGRSGRALVNAIRLRGYNDNAWIIASGAVGHVEVVDYVEDDAFSSATHQKLRLLPSSSTNTETDEGHEGTPPPVSFPRSFPLGSLSELTASSCSNGKAADYLLYVPAQ